MQGMISMKKSIIIGLIIMIIIALIIAVQIKDATGKGVELLTLNNMYSDIEKLEDKISMYYLNYGFLPVNKERPSEFKSNSINPNDGDNCYEIDLSKLENLDLSYGMKLIGEDDVYIIHENSHTIYYVKGVNYNNEKYYTKKLDYEKIDLDKF